MFATRTQWETSENRLAQALRNRRESGLPVLDLTESNPTRCGLEYDEEAVLEALAARGSMLYEPHPLGLPEARKAVSEYYAGRGIDAPLERILLTSGTSEAYSFLFRLLAEPGDEVLVPSPSYPLLELLAELNDVRLVRYPLVYDHGWRIDLESLPAAITPSSRALVVVSPNNPTGSFLQYGELAALTGLAKRHKLALIADEVFADYAWGDVLDRAASVAGVEGCLAFTLNGLSKTSGLPQMKLGWIVVNGPAALVADAMARLEIIGDTYLSVETPVQRAAKVLLGQAKRMQPQIMERIHGNLKFLDKRLESNSTLSRLRGEGGWYAVLRGAGIESDEDWAVELLDRDGVYLHPGHLFEFDGEGYLVVSLISPESDFRKGVGLLARRDT